MKAYELLQQVKDLCLYGTTGRDSQILQRLNIEQFSLYNMEFHWRSLEKSTDLTTTANSPFTSAPSDAGILYDIRQVSTSPYSKIIYVPPYKFHEIVPQPAIFSFNRPRYYCWFAGKVWWYPIPDAVYVMTTWYYARPTQMQIYTTGTATLATLTLTGSSTFWTKGLNVDATGLYFAFTADQLSDGTYPWAQLASISADTTATLAAAYTGATASGAYVISSAPTFTAEFDPYMVYAAALVECARDRELSQTAQALMQDKQAHLQGLIRNQTAIPDFIDGQQDFAREPIMLGDDYAKFPFIQSNP
jgi:hypothetical protein